MVEINHTLSEDVAKQLQPLLQMMDRYDSLMNHALAIARQTTQQLMKAQVEAEEGSVAARQMLERDLNIRKSEENFAFLVLESQFESLAELKRQEKEALELFPKIAEVAGRLSASGNCQLKPIIEGLADNDYLALKSEAVEQAKRAAQSAFQRAIRDLGIHGQQINGR